MNISALDDFRLVAAHGGFGKASRATGRSKATLSRRVAELENALALRLIERGGGRLELTEAGRLLVNRIEGPLREVAEAIEAAREERVQPRGRLRIAAPVLFSQLALGGLAAAFIARYPDVEIEAISDDRRVHLVDEHFDVAIRINPSDDSLLVGRCFARDGLELVAAPALAPPAMTAGQAALVPAVVMPTHRDGHIWSMRGKQSRFQPQPVLRLSSLLAIRDAVLAGAGAAMLPRSLVASALERGALVSWGVAGDETELWVLHTSRRLQSPKVRAFVEFLCARYPDGRFDVPPQPLL